MTTMYYLYMGLRLLPINLDHIRHLEHIGHMESTNNAIIVSGQAGAVSAVDANGTVLTCVNSSDRDIGFALDLSSNRYDANKSWRIKLSYPTSCSIDLEAQRLDLVEAGWKHWFTFKNEIVFDSLLPLIISTTSTEQVLLWNKPEDIEVLSTPWIRHSIGVNIRAHTNGEFGCHFYGAADLNMDGNINGADLTILTASWNMPLGDVNGDGTTNAVDMSLLLDAWTPTN